MLKDLDDGASLTVTMPSRFQLPLARRTDAREGCCRIRELFFKKLRTPALGASQFPSVLTDTKGEIRKPARW